MRLRSCRKEKMQRMTIRVMKRVMTKPMMPINVFPIWASSSCFIRSITNSLMRERIIAVMSARGRNDSDWSVSGWVMMCRLRLIRFFMR